MANTIEYIITVSEQAVAAATAKITTAANNAFRVVVPSIQNSAAWTQQAVSAIGAATSQASGHLHTFLNTITSIGRAAHNFSGGNVPGIGPASSAVSSITGMASGGAVAAGVVGAVAGLGAACTAAAFQLRDYSAELYSTVLQFEFSMTALRFQIAQEVGPALSAFMQQLTKIAMAMAPLASDVLISISNLLVDIAPAIVKILQAMDVLWKVLVAMSDKANASTGGVGGKVATGAGVGAAVGSMIPGIGTGIGAGIGATAGLVAGVAGTMSANKTDYAARSVKSMEDLRASVDRLTSAVGDNTDESELARNTMLMTQTVWRSVAEWSRYQGKGNESGWGQMQWQGFNRVRDASIINKEQNNGVINGQIGDHLTVQPGMSVAERFLQRKTPTVSNPEGMISPQGVPRPTPAAVHFKSADTITIQFSDEERLSTELARLADQLMSKVSDFNNGRWLRLSQARLMMSQGLGV